MANTFRKIYKKTGNSGSASDYQLVGNIGVGGVELDLMKGATSSADGELGLVPKPTKGQENFILTGNGSFKDITDVLNTVGWNKAVSRNGTGCSVRFDNNWVAIFINARVSLNTTVGYVNSIILPEYTVSSSDAVTMTVAALRSDWRPENNIHLRISFSDNVRNANITLQTNINSISNLHIAAYSIFPRPWFNIDEEGIPGTVM